MADQKASSQPPATPPPPPPTGDVPPAPSAGGQRNTLMLVLAYLGLLALIPLIVEKNDREVQWHAKHGLVILAAFVVLQVAIAVMGSLMPFFFALGYIVWLGWFLVTILGIVKAVNGQRLLIPGLSEFADKF